MESIKDKLGLTMNQDSMTSEDHEKFRIECNGRAYLHGLVVGPLTFCSVYFAQKFFTKKMEVTIFFQDNIYHWSCLIVSDAKYIIYVYIVCINFSAP